MCYVNVAAYGAEAGVWAVHLDENRKRAGCTL